MDLYAENILDHFRNPRCSGELSDATIDHREENLECGDDVHVWLRVRDGVVTDISWTGTGCAISQASMSILCEEFVGKSEEDVLRFSKEDVYELLGVPIGPRRFKCALMGLHCIKNALHKAAGRPVQSWVETVALG